MSKNDPLNHLQWELRVDAKASQWHFSSLCFSWCCGCFHASLSLLFPLRMFHPQLISSFFSSWKICEQMSIRKKKEWRGRERNEDKKRERNKTKNEVLNCGSMDTHASSAIFSCWYWARGREPWQPRWHGQREREREDIHESHSLSGSWRLLLVLFTAAHHLCSPRGCTHLQSSDVKDSKLRE